ncbi:MAG: hypothetical protein AAF938_23745, partial [Myxococcota bacterium]
EAVLAGAERTLESMVRFVLIEGDVSRAEALLAEHSSPPASLREEVESAKSDQTRRARRVARLEADVDVRIGARVRAIRVFVAASVWAAACFGAGAWVRAGHALDYMDVAYAGVVLLGGNLVGIARARKVLLRTAANRRLIFAGLLVFVNAIVLWPLLGAMGLSLAQTTVVGAAFGGIVWSLPIIDHGMRWSPVPLSHFAVAALAFRWPAYHFEWFGSLSLALLVVAYWTHRLSQEA